MDAISNTNKVEDPSLPISARLADFWEMTKPGITVMVVLTAGLGFLLAEGKSFAFVLLVHTLLGTWLISAGASVLNQVLERETDALMTRTATRPLPAGRMDPDSALFFGVVLAVVGLADLALAVNLLTALLGAVALAGYVFVYTPLKRVSSLATVIGAIPGALPPVMGWSAVTGDVSLAAWVLFGILFFWQMPHFLAISWLCREDYANAGFPMLTVLDPQGTRTARQMILYGAALVPVLADRSAAVEAAQAAAFPGAVSRSLTISNAAGWAAGTAAADLASLAARTAVPAAS